MPQSGVRRLAAQAQDDARPNITDEVMARHPHRNLANDPPEGSDMRFTGMTVYGKGKKAREVNTYRDEQMREWEFKPGAGRPKGRKAQT
jgi:hypothetical protein